MVKTEMPGRQCVAFGCYKRCYSKKRPRSDSEGSDDEESQVKKLYPRTFHRFPLDPKLWQMWVSNIRRKNWTPTKNSLLCSDHFREKVLDRTGCLVRLRSNALPTRFKGLDEKQFEQIQRSHKINPRNRKTILSTRYSKAPSGESNIPVSSCIYAFLLDHDYAASFGKKIKTENSVPEKVLKKETKNQKPADSIKHSRSAVKNVVAYSSSTFPAVLHDHDYAISSEKRKWKKSKFSKLRIQFRKKT